MPCAFLMISAARSPMTTHGAIVFPLGTLGMIEYPRVAVARCHKPAIVHSRRTSSRAPTSRYEPDSKRARETRRPLAGGARLQDRRALQIQRVGDVARSAHTIGTVPLAYAAPDGRCSRRKQERDQVCDFAWLCRASQLDAAQSLDDELLATFVVCPRSSGEAFDRDGGKAAKSR